jgi:hypothetical protein
VYLGRMLMVTKSFNATRNFGAYKMPNVRAPCFGQSLANDGVCRAEKVPSD